MQQDVPASTMTMSERADALEEQMMHDLEHIVTKSVLFNLADGKVEMEGGAALLAKNPGKFMLMGEDPRLPKMPQSRHWWTTSDVGSPRRPISCKARRTHSKLATTKK